MLQRGAVRRSDYQSYQTARATEGDRARGISAERFEIPLAGGVAASVPASAVGWRATCAAWGEPARPGFPPEGETGKGEINFPCCRRRLAAGCYGAVQGVRWNTAWCPS